MAKIHVKNTRSYIDENGNEVLVLAYDLPNAVPIGPDPSLAVGHEHHIPISAVWARMQQYGIDRGKAIEECVLAILEPELFAYWPVYDEKRAQARRKHDTTSVRGHAAKVRMPVAAELARVRRNLRLDEKRPMPVRSSNADRQ